MLDSLIRLIDSKIAEAGAKDSSDGGLIESIKTREIEKELRELIDIENE